MFKALCKSRVQAFTASFLRADRKGKVRSKGSLIGFGLLFAYVGVCFLGLFYMMASSLAQPFAQAGLNWLYFALFGIMATGLAVIGSIFTTQSQLFEAKDNELLLAMPIPPSYILGSRMVALYGQNLLMELLVLLPALAAYIINVGMAAGNIALFALVALTLPLLALTLSCILGFLVAILVSRMRSKSLFTLILSLAFFGAYFYAFSQMNSYLQYLSTNGASIAQTIQRALYPLYQMGMAVMGNPASVGLYLVCMIAPFALVYWAISRSFLHIATSKRGASKIRYTEKKLDVSSPLRALYRREMQHLWASPMYMLNGAFGSVFLIVGAVALVLKKDALVSFAGMIPGMQTMLPVFLALAISVIASMNLITAPSISLEGKGLWIVQSFPLRGWTVLKSKLLLHVAINAIPSLLCSVVGILTMPMTAIEAAIVILAPQVFSLFCGIAGLIINLRFPRFDWTSEAVVVKRGMSVMLTLFGAWAVVLLLWIGYMLLRGVLGMRDYVLVCTVLLAVISLLLQRWLKTKGEVIFESLH